MCQGILGIEIGFSASGDAKFNRIYWVKHVLFNVVLTILIPQVKTPGDGRYRTHRDSTLQVANVNNLSPGGPAVKV